MAYEPPNYIEPRNPWTGHGQPWKEFLYDVHHPILFVKRGFNGVKETFRWISKGGWIYRE